MPGNKRGNRFAASNSQGNDSEKIYRYPELRQRAVLGAFRNCDRSARWRSGSLERGMEMDSKKPLIPLNLQDLMGCI
jgi:hypothetical protein